jgi:hypothetical protein
LQEYGAVLPQWLGMTGLVFCAIVWLITGRIEPLLMSAFGGLIFVGQAGEAYTSLKKGPPTPPPVPDSTVEDGA